MKKLILILAAFMTIGCSKDDERNSSPNCTTCIESKTQTKQQFCGTPSEVKDFKEMLIKYGKNLGQYWKCK